MNKTTVDRSDVEDLEDENSRLMASLDRLGESQERLIAEHRQLAADLMDARGSLVEAMALLQLVLSGRALIQDAEAWLNAHKVH